MTLGNCVDNRHDNSSWCQDATINADDNNNHKADLNKIINIDGDNGVNNDNQVNNVKNRDDKNEHMHDYDSYDSSASEDNNCTATTGSSNEALKKEKEEDGEEQENGNDIHVTSFYHCSRLKQKENNLRKRRENVDRWLNVKSYFVSVVDAKIDASTTIPFMLFGRDINILRRVCDDDVTLFHFLCCPMQQDLNYSTTWAVSDKQSEESLQINKKNISTPKWQTDNPSVVTLPRNTMSASCQLGCSD